MSEELTITKERVLETAEKCPEAKEIFKVMFPSAFKSAVDFKIGDIVESGSYGLGIIKSIMPSQRLFIGVEFFSNARIPGTHSLNGLSALGHGWWVEGNKLLLHYRPK